MKLCTHCGEVKYNKDFHKNKWSSDGLQNWCKECQLKAISTGRKKKKVAKRKNDLKRIHRYKIKEGLNYKLDRGSNTITYNCLKCGKEITSSLNKAWKNRYKCDDCVNHNLDKPINKTIDKAIDKAVNKPINKTVKHIHTKEKPIIVVHEYYISDDVIKEEKKSIFSWIKNLFRRNK